MGRRRRSPDDLDGVLVVDKPAGPTSHDVVQTVRRAAGQHRVGHTGTLDPPATGVLVLCLGRAAKLVRFLQAGQKTYAARMVLGVTTSTQDAEGEVLARASARGVDERRLCEALTRFQGELDQVPPMVSAVKVGGERLHELARRGEEVEREARRVTVHDLMLDAFDTSDPDHPSVSLLVTCSSGTYVRTLAHDIGETLGVGASLLALRRLANGPFGVEDAHDLDTVRAAGTDGSFRQLVLRPEDAVARALPGVEVDDAELALALTQGKPVLPAQGREGVYAVRHGDRLLGLYADRGPTARSELVWTRPHELHAAGGAAG
ncbi:tRNA pseudouridine(55) synthase TruB [Egicoccus halophilus]|uniref:tRNA pseudouridine synthase B n=1 Tax=Egicoccus halophilus TaxID=1670830 RepID=A0A8J3AER0_9ACTN|nr:tRNA pseudouridine(55) synthase TruB [Egicoccus halophilus]GGI06534.1 tRNA pseudouridine synthase B [Egicoccus halophilus]